MARGDRWETADTPIFEQGPRIPPGVYGLPLLAWSYGAFRNVADGYAADARSWILLTLMVLGLAAVIVVAVVPQSAKRVAVDGRGLHVSGELRLPAARIGRVQALRGWDAATQSWPLSRNRGLKMPSKQNLYGGLYGFGPAVGVEEVDRRGERVSTWLLPTPRPEELRDALLAARDAARR